MERREDERTGGGFDTRDDVVEDLVREARKTKRTERKGLQEDLSREVGWGGGREGGEFVAELLWGSFVVVGFGDKENGVSCTVFAVFRNCRFQQQQQQQQLLLGAGAHSQLLWQQEQEDKSSCCCKG
jgi:hypothetical protein